MTTRFPAPRAAQENAAWRHSDISSRTTYCDKRVAHHAVFFLVFLALSGCASCPPATVYKIAPVNHDGNVSSHTDWENRTILRISPDVRLAIHTCWKSGLCITASSPEGRRLQFTSDEFLEIDDESNHIIRSHHPDVITFFQSCEERRNVPRTCSSSEDPPTAAAVRITSVSDTAHADWKYRAYVKVFPATAEFVGAADRETRETIVRGQRNYRIVVFSEGRRNARPYRVRFPDLKVDGKAISLPEIRIREAIEAVCRYRAY